MSGTAERDVDANQGDKSNLSHPAETDIQRWVGESSFGRGRRYFHEGYIFDARLQGQVIKARCLGSQPQPYRVQAHLGPAGLVSADCSCPIGDGGRCKHVAALLLTWLHHPDTFTPVEELVTALQRRSPAELIALIARMVARYPDLEALLELPTLDEVASRQPINVELIRRQVHHAFSGGDYNGGYVTFDFGGLYELVDLGGEYAGREDWPNAAVVYETVAREVLGEYGSFQDESGDLIGIVADCVSGLGECLAGADPGLRDRILQTLFDIYRWDLEYGGVGASDEVPGILLDQASAEEKEQIAQWVRQALPRGDSWGENYHRQRLGGFLLDLEAAEQDDELFLHTCRETGRLNDLVERLLTLGRVEEAVEAAGGADDYTLLALANLLVTHGHAEPAERLVRERAQGSRDDRLLAWLKERALARGDGAEALALAEVLFWRGTTLERYQELQTLAQPLGRWDKLRATVLSRLAEGRHHGLLTEIYLHEGAIDQALRSLEQGRATGWGWMSGGLALRVAQTAEEGRPREAIRLYMEAVESLIRGQGRANYVTAAGHLRRVRDLHHRLGEVANWEKVITTLREKNRRLRALKEELDRAGL